MAHPLHKYYLIDFDSTFITTEGIEELARVALKKNPHKNELLKKIEELTTNAMNGELSFEVSLEQRIQLLQANRSHIDKVITILKKNVSRSIKQNKHFFKEYSGDIYIISGGFKDFIIPIVAPFGIAADHVFANTFIYDEKDNIISVDKNNFLSQNDGKVKQVNELKLLGDLYCIGDGYTDYQLKEVGLVKEFIAFTENIRREAIVQNADHVAPSFHEFLSVINYRPR